MYTLLLLRWVSNRDLLIAQRTLLKVLWQPGQEWSLRENGSVYVFGSVPSLFTWNYHNIVYPNTKILWLTKIQNKILSLECICGQCSHIYIWLITQSSTNKEASKQVNNKQTNQPRCSERPELLYEWSTVYLGVFIPWRPTTVSPLKGAQLIPRPLFVPSCSPLHLIVLWIVVRPLMGPEDAPFLQSSTELCNHGAFFSVIHP